MAEVALTYERDDDTNPASVLLVVDGSANGEHVRFVIDTGAKTSSVPDVGSISKLAAIGTDTGLSASATSSGDDVVIINEIIVGDLTAKAIQASRSDHTRRPLLGMDVLGRHCCHFEFSNSRLELDGPVYSRRATRELARQVNGSPLVDVDFGSVTVQACWDTGASLTVIDAQFARANPQLVDAGRASTQVPALFSTLAHSTPPSKLRLTSSSGCRWLVEPIGSSTSQTIDGVSLRTERFKTVPSPPGASEGLRSQTSAARSLTDTASLSR